MPSKPSKRKVPGSRSAPGGTGRTTPPKNAKPTTTKPAPTRSATAKPAVSRSSQKVKGDTHQGATKRSTASETRAKASEANSPGPSKYSSRYTPPVRDLSQMPSPLWVPILMFSLLGLGMIVIILNYIGVLGTASNWRLLLGLGLILGGIMTATKYR